MKIALTVPGPRALVSLEEAQAASTCFQNLLRSSSSVGGGDGTTGMVVVVDLSCRLWTVETLQVLFQGMDWSHVHTLKCDDVIASLPTEQGLAVLELLAQTFQYSPIHTLQLHDNAIGTRGIAVLQPLLQLPTLRKLNLENTGLAHADAATLVSILPEHKLQALSLGRNQMGVQGACHIGEYLKTCTDLRYFSYVGCRPLREGTKAICQGLAAAAAAVHGSNNNKGLRYLNLNDNDLGQDDDDDDEDDDDDNDSSNETAVAALANALRKSHHLHTLIVSDCVLELSGLESLLEALEEAQAALVHFNVSGNGELGQQGAASLATYLEKYCVESLETLCVDTNELGDDGVEALIDFLSVAERLKTIDLKCNEITKRGATALLLLLATPQIKARLECLDLTDNTDITAHVAKMFKDVFLDKDNKNGEVIRLDDELEDDDEEQQAEVDKITDLLSGMKVD